MSHLLTKRNITIAARYCVFVLTVVLVTRAAHANEPAPLRVMSFNIRLGVAKDGDNHWDKRKDLVVDTIRAFRADLVGTQETWHFQADHLKKNLPEFGYVGWTRQAGKEGEQCGILFRKDRFDVVESGQFWLSKTPEMKGSKSWDSSLPRIVTWIELKDKLADGRQLRFLNTHFDHIGKVARLEAAKMIRESAKKYASRPVIVTGDFNCSDTSAPYKALFEGQILTDSFRAKYPTKQPKEGTFNGFKGTDTGARIDWVLHNDKFATVDAAVDKTSKDGRYPSDHFPVTAVLKWQPAAN
jgi:endonuclease/exonuclease/phosphatase family metal-dependent hydrolase